MSLSRLDNFLKSARGTILYVDPNSIDSTDSIENQGNSLTRPFKTIQRALIEASRFSYQKGKQNDRYNKTTILLYPGDHIVDNRPGFIVDTNTSFYKRSGAPSTDFGELDLSSNFDLIAENNVLYKFNSVHGGVIVPRGTSIIGLDLRKTKIRPTYVPNPANEINNIIERSAIFRVTGGCYFWQFTILDSDPNGNCYKDYTTNQFVPNFSHHKLTGFEYADGKNPVKITDTFAYSTTRTDLDMYYEKISIAYGQSSGRPIEPDYPFEDVTIEKKVEEYRIVGSKGFNIGITSIRAGDGGANPSNIITVILQDNVNELSVDTAINIGGINQSPEYNGQWTISDIINSNTVQYKILNIPTNPNLSSSQLQDAYLSLEVDTTTSSSPYIFNVSLRSVYGMCGLLADGDKVTGFKSMVIAQFTGIGLQKDDKAFVVYNKESGTYSNWTQVDNLHTNPESKYRPSYRNYHVKAINDAYIQVVSVFAIGYAEHFTVENGGDLSINNSNSNFGAKSLVASGFKRDAFEKDDSGYITHIISPRELETIENSIEFNAIDVSRTVGVALTNQLYLYNQNNLNNLPHYITDGYRIGARPEDNLKVSLNYGGNSIEYSSRIIMSGTEYTSNETSFEKSVIVQRIANNSENNIVNNLITLTTNHSFLNGESVRIISDTGFLPDGILNNQIYYAITTGLASNQIKLAQTLSDATSATPAPIALNKTGGLLTIVSRVSDKKSGDIGHPIQWNSSVGQWYTNVATASTENQLYNVIVGLGTAVLGSATPRTYFKRNPDTRNLIDTVYRLRYVIPKDSPSNARPPLDGFILQESSSGIGTGTAEIGKYLSLGDTTEDLVNSNDLRNFRFISNCTYDGTTATIISELPHNLVVGNEVKIHKVKSSNNTTADDTLGYNGTFVVTQIINAKSFQYSLTENPGTFTNDTTVRDSELPHFSRKKYSTTYAIYRAQEVQKFISGSNGQDGIYYLLVVNSSNQPTVEPFRDLKFYQSIQNYYPQTNRDNPSSDPKAAISHAVSNPIGDVVINDPQKSITRETLEKYTYDLNIGVGITNIISNGTGTTHIIYTDVDHGLCGITSISITNAGSGYTPGTYYNVELISIGGIVGNYATAKIKVNGSGNITEIKIIDGGSAYSVGNTVRPNLSYNGTQSVFTVNNIYNNVGDCLSIAGIAGTYFDYNNLYRIESITNVKSINTRSSSIISPATTIGIDSIDISKASLNLTGNTLIIDQFDYDSVTGLATIGFTTSHGLKVDTKFKIGISDNNDFNVDGIVKQTLGTPSKSIIANIGITTTATTISIGGSEYAYQYSLSSRGGALNKNFESQSGRLAQIYSGITTYLGTTILVTSPDNTNLNIPGARGLGFKIGDYLSINNEIFKIKGDVNSDSIKVFRSLLGSSRESHYAGSVIRKIKPIPVELRKNSIIRASGHTFEYVGFGPGNYSTGLPEDQSRSLTGTEEILAHSFKDDGGLIVFTGMNNDGAFYVGNKRVSSATGQEEVFDTPIPSTTGEDISLGDASVGFDIISPLEASISRSIRVEGGPDSNIISEFDGPVIFNNKITSTSSKGVEVNSLFIQGDATVSRNFTVGISTPTYAGNPGDIVTKAEPKGKGDYIGWSYTLNNTWEPFGYLSSNGVGISSAGSYIGFASLLNFVGTGLTITSKIDTTLGITTVYFDANPKIGISSGPNNTFIGNASSINFIGYGLTVTTDYDSITGVSTVSIVGRMTDDVGIPGSPDTSIQYNNSGNFGGIPELNYNNVLGKLSLIGNNSSNLFTILQNGSGNSLVVEDTVFTNSGTVGLGNNEPLAKLDILVPSNQNIPALKIQTISGNSNVVEILNSSGDTTPFIINNAGNVGINTGTLISNVALDVVGNLALNQELRIYEPDRSNYIGLSAPTTSNNLSFILPNSYGTSGQILSSNGVGGFVWTNVSTQNVNTGLGLTISSSTVNGITVSTISNTGVNSIRAGYGVSVSTNNGESTISMVPDSSPYPFTTRGFSFVF